MENKTINILGGGTFSHVRNHLALATPAFGTTARLLKELCEERWNGNKNWGSSKGFYAKLSQSELNTVNVNLYLTKMADNDSDIITNEDVENLALKLKDDLNTKVIFFNVAMCDYIGIITDYLSPYEKDTESGKYAPRLKTNEGYQSMVLKPTEKIVKNIRNGRKDIFLVAFKTTCGATEQEQYLAGLDLVKRGSCNLVLANDTKTRLNMIITPEEAKYHVTTDRNEALKQLVDMTYYRSHLTFTRSTVVNGNPVSWNNPLVFSSLKIVVNYCIEKNAYKPFNGVTVGHFACKIYKNEFLTSIRKTNFNDLEKTGLVHIITNTDDTVIAYGAKPSVGGQSQRIIFSEHQDYDCIVHFHCPLKPNSQVPVVSQREYECGSHQCGQNTSKGLKQFNNLSAVMLDNHGPNIVFHHSIDPLEVIKFIENNFDLNEKTGGLV